LPLGARHNSAATKVELAPCTAEARRRSRLIKRVVVVYGMLEQMPNVIHPSSPLRRGRS
jgi:hypothetical protein